MGYGKGGGIEVDTEFNFDLGEVEYENLNSDADFRKEAQRLLPAAMEHMGKAIAELSWAFMQRDWVSVTFFLA